MSSDLETSAGTVWRGSAPSGNELHVARQVPGPWRVVYGGFSRSSGLVLASVIAEAAGVPSSTEWVQALAYQIKGVSP